ncbi:hypothetical protein Emtol_0703 [Emticicia oligotrophica DSM 17448]|uniref:Uncharacterized protein n=1 Tax=Emticicia oligotrophica (strain DSM 17448 / CIP 109782 / MTCC 6937 / GPTSA100-15) TaxID=929562 RepID=A0ABM5MXI0_EMTOG|nr:hypothetical protein [Emticicia oligotrophica]AFK01856.1 hypothetical protein Emtol_0703 [Emticicia oligotrophica DSM 17448]
MKVNLFYLGLTLIALLVECLVHDLIEPVAASFWSNNLRIISSLILAAWYYQMQKSSFYTPEKWMLVSILLPIVISLTMYLMLEKYAIIINITVNLTMLGILIYCFKKLGAKINFKDSNDTFNKIFPAFFIFPFVFYFFVLYNALSGIYAIIVFIYVLIFSYTGILSVFLPINENKRLFIIIGITLLVVANIMNAYHTFLEKVPWGYPVIRTITVISRGMIIYGMARAIKYVEKSNQQPLRHVKV